MVADGTRMLSTHSLRLVVACESLCARSEWPMRSLVTLGSPLGVHNLLSSTVSDSGLR
jgi:hypothetical protein